MNYGTPKDWMKYQGSGYCDSCMRTSTWETTDAAEDTLDGDYLCNDCYQKLVVTPNLKLLTKNDLTDDLAGKEVVCIENVGLSGWLTVGKLYTVIKCHDHRFEIRVDTKEKKEIRSHDYFALPAGTPAPQMQERCVTAPVPTQPEITYSCTLEFPDGKTVTIPGPGGNDWKTETERFDWPKKHYKDLWTKLQLHDVKHNNGKLIFKEYAIRMHNENARIISITKWTRDPNYTPPEREETFEERARRWYPSRMRG